MKISVKASAEIRIMNFFKKLLSNLIKKNTKEDKTKSELKQNVDFFLFKKKFEKKDKNINIKLLKKHNLPYLTNLKLLKKFFNFKNNNSFIKFLNAFIIQKDNFYKTYKIKKRNSNEYREISQPIIVIKLIQLKILQEILYKIPAHKNAYGFIKNKSFIKNAKQHIKKKILFGYDIKDFFPSINSKQVYKLFRKLGYGKLISFILTQLTTYKDKLPQGACTSPYLSNLIFFPLDNKITKLSEKFNFTYSRYADNLFFSKNEFKKYQFYKEYKTFTYYIKKILKNYNFKLNNKKSFIAPYYKKQKINSIIVNEKLNIDKKYYQKIRIKLHKAKYKNLTSYQKMQIQGKLSYIKSVNPDKYEKLINKYNFSFK